jgi:hypothetical protein
MTSARSMRMWRASVVHAIRASDSDVLLCTPFYESLAVRGNAARASAARRPTLGTTFRRRPDASNCWLHLRSSRSTSAPVTDRAEPKAHRTAPLNAASRPTAIVLPHADAQRRYVPVETVLRSLSSRGGRHCRHGRMAARASRRPGVSARASSRGGRSSGPPARRHPGSRRRQRPYPARQQSSRLLPPRAARADGRPGPGVRDGADTMAASGLQPATTARWRVGFPDVLGHDRRSIR